MLGCFGVALLLAPSLLLSPSAAAAAAAAAAAPAPAPAVVAGVAPDSRHN